MLSTKVGLFDNPYPGDDRRPETVVHNDAHKAVSMKTALESIVLLKNENQMLPLSRNFSKIAVIGPNAEEVKELTCRYGPAIIHAWFPGEFIGECYR